MERVHVKERRRPSKFSKQLLFSQRQTPSAFTHELLVRTALEITALSRTGGAFNYHDMLQHDFGLALRAIEHLVEGDDYEQRMGQEPWQLARVWKFEDDYINPRGIMNTIFVARELGLEPGDELLEIGSHLGSIARQFHLAYGANVTGIGVFNSKDIQINEAACILNVAMGIHDHVYSFDLDFLKSKWEKNEFDHVFSSTVIATHFPDQHKAVFQKAASCLKLGGKIFVEDYYTEKPLGD